MRSKNQFVAALFTFLICTSYGVSASSDGSGLKTTPTGIPWYVSDRTSNYPGAEAAMRIASSKWREPWAMKIKSGKASGKFRLVSVNGSTYVVLAKMKGPFSLSAETVKTARAELLRAAAGKANCTTQGGILAKYTQYNDIEKMAAKVQCSFL